MTILILVAVALACWLILRGRRPLPGLARVAALAFAAFGLFRALEGSLILGAAMIAIGLLYFWNTDEERRRVVAAKARARVLLGVGPDATPDDIRAAHRRLAATTHPDLGGSHAEMQEINVARDLLLRQGAPSARQG